MTKRIQMDMPERSVERLNRMKDHVEAASYAEVVREALKLYEYIIEEDSKGNGFAIRKPDGTYENIKLFL